MTALNDWRRNHGDKVLAANLVLSFRGIVVTNMGYLTSLYHIANNTILDIRTIEGRGKAYDDGATEVKTMIGLMQAIRKTEVWYTSTTTDGAIIRAKYTNVPRNQPPAKFRVATNPSRSPNCLVCPI